STAGGAAETVLGAGAASWPHPPTRAARSRTDRRPTMRPFYGGRTAPRAALFLQARLQRFQVPAGDGEDPAEDRDRLVDRLGVRCLLLRRDEGLPRLGQQRRRRLQLQEKRHEQLRRLGP